MFEFRFISTVVAAVLLAICLACGGTAAPPVIPPPPPSCDPAQAAELIQISVHNSGSGSLTNYPVAVSFDRNTFDFSLASSTGDNLAVWDANSKAPLSFWIESYDPQAGKALLWVKIPTISTQADPSIWITAGPIAHCSSQTGSGYAVFPFFSDVQDVANWTTDGGLALSNTVTAPPLSIQDRQVIESDGMYNGSPSVVQAANGDWVLAYRKGTGHVNVPLIVFRRSQDMGITWSPEVVYFNTSGPDPTLARTPGGDLMLATDKEDPTGLTGTAYGRSVDNGLTWGPFTFFDQPLNNTYSFPTAFVNDGATIYAASYGASSFDTTTSPFLWSSADDGLTWAKLSELRNSGDPGTDETAIAKVGPTRLLAIMRTVDSVTTYGRFSDDMGQTWGPLISYTAQLGALQLPQLIQAGNALVLLGREYLLIPGAGIAGAPRQLVAFVSYDGGQTFKYGTVLDTYTGLPIDGGYCWPLLQADGRVFVVYYADSNNLQKPDIKSLVLQVNPPNPSASSSLHVVSQIASGEAAHSLIGQSSKYALEFRFRSQEIAVGSQFSVALQALDNAGQPVTLVNWELPSTHSVDPRQISGFTSNNQFVPLLTSFTYDQPYRLRTIVDESHGLQEGTSLDLFGAILASSSQTPLAQATSLHATRILVGNNSNLRETDSLLDFVFVRDVAEVEPQVTASRVH